MCGDTLPITSACQCFSSIEDFDVPSFRIRVAISKGQTAIELAQLAAMMADVNAFLRALGNDAGIPEQDNVWRAATFKDGSLVYSGITPDTVSTASVARCGLIADAMLRGDAVAARDVGAREQTFFQFEKMAKRSKATTPLQFGLYKKPASSRPTWYAVTSESATKLVSEIQPWVDYQGAVHGVIHSWFKESDQPYFVLRDSGRQELIKCLYGAKFYAQVVAALQAKDAIVFVNGLIRANRVDRTFESIKVERLRIAPAFTDTEFEAFSGIAPALTGRESSADFVQRVRNNID
jgi:hypothetical protein